MLELPELLPCEALLSEMVGVQSSDSGQSHARPREGVLL